MNIVSPLSCEAILKISSSNIRKCGRKSKKGPILIKKTKIEDWSFFGLVRVRVWVRVMVKVRVKVKFRVHKNSGLGL